MDTLLKFRECMEYLRVGERTLRRYIKEERVPAFKVGGQYRFKKSVLDKLIEEGKL